MDREKANEILDEIAVDKNLGTADKHFRTAGVITEYVKEKIGINLIVVGGLSVEVYTEGSYMTNDIDFVGSNHVGIMDCLKDLGYITLNEAGINMLGGSVMRYHPRLESLVEVPSSRLKDADEERVNVVETPDELKVNIIGVEDIIADRIRSTVHDDTKVHVIHILDMLETYQDKIDMSYLESVLIDKERIFLNQMREMLSKPFEPEQQLNSLRLALDGLNYGIGKIYSSMENLIVFKIGSHDYVGMTTLPFMMIYVFSKEEDSLIPLYDNEEAMPLDEVVSWFENPNHTNGIDFSEFIEILKNVIKSEE